jgi:nanoRNase/pAp phosphatase (c-di-AMP/oligoRNAs hydrolase)
MLTVVSEQAKAPYELITRSDMDGLVCATMLKSIGLIDSVRFVHPKDMQDGLITVSRRSITANVPYSKDAHLVFDHHASEALRLGGELPANLVLDGDAPSAARVVYRHCGADTFAHISQDMLTAVDKADSASFTREEVFHPTGWVLLSFLMDPRTGLGRFRDFNVSNYDLMMALIDYCVDMPVEKILELRDVSERVRLYFEQEKLFVEQLKRVGQMRGVVLYVPLKEEKVIHAGNRFIKYAIFPEANISVLEMLGFRGANTVFAVGKSIFRRDNPVNVGEVMLRHGGGGHQGAGTCQVPHAETEPIREELLRVFDQTSPSTT